MIPDCRNDILSRVARDLEFSAHSMSTSAEGYGERTRAKVDAIKMLKKPEAWLGEEEWHGEDFEDAKDVLDVVHRLCKVGIKGKGRAVG